MRGENIVVSKFWVEKWYHLIIVVWWSFLDHVVKLRCATFGLWMWKISSEQLTGLDVHTELFVTAAAPHNHHRLAGLLGHLHRLPEPIHVARTSCHPSLSQRDGEKKLWFLDSHLNFHPHRWFAAKIQKRELISHAEMGNTYSPQIKCWTYRLTSESKFCPVRRGGKMN